MGACHEEGHEHPQAVKLGGDRRAGGVGDDGVDFLAQHGFLCKGQELDGGAGPDDAGDHVAGFGRAAELRHHVAHHLPAAGRRKSLLVLGRSLQQLRAVLEEGGDFGDDAAVGGPGVPVIGVDLKIEVDEAVGERAREPEGHRLVLAAIACRNDAPAFGKFVFADPAVENELIERGLHERRRGVDLVEEENAGLVGLLRQEGRRAPDGRAVLDHRNAAQVGRIEQGGADVDERHAAALGDLAHDRALADAGGAPDESGPGLVEKVFKYGGKSRGFHVGGSLASVERCGCRPAGHAGSGAIQEAFYWRCGNNASLVVRPVGLVHARGGGRKKGSSRKSVERGLDF